jgi:hypothetical protein
MYKNSVPHSSLRRFLRSAIPAAVLAAVCSGTPAHAQAVPIPFAGKLAGLGTVCTGSIPTFAPPGKTPLNVGDGCLPATQATFNTPVALGIDHYGNIFVADQSNNLIRVIYNGGDAMAAAIVASNVQATGLVPVKGNIYTLAGQAYSGTLTAPTTTYCNQNGTGATGTNKQLDGCPGVEAYILPRGFGVDNDGNIFFGSVGVIYDVRVFYVGGAAAAKLITLENPTITTPQVGYVYNIAGLTANATFAGEGKLANLASINIPRALWIDANENIYLTDTQNNLIRKIDGSTGITTTVVGPISKCTTTCPAGDAAGDGSPATDPSVQMFYPYGVVFDRYGNMFIADSGNQVASTTLHTAGGLPSSGRIRVVYAGGTLPGISNPVVGNIYTYAGGGAITGTPAQQAIFQFVYGVALDSQGYLYIDDYRNGSTAGSNHIWRVDPTNGNITIVAGTGASSAPATATYCNGGSTGPIASNTRGDGCPATQAYMNSPQQAPVFDANGNMYIAERSTNIVRSFTYNNLFPATAIGSSVTQPLAFLYPATSLPISAAATVQGSAATDFSDAGGDTCALNTTLATATTCVDYVKFAPTSVGSRFGSFTVSSATGTIATQSVSGVGSAPIFTIDPGTAVSLGSGIQPLGVSADQLGNVYLSDGTGKQVLRTTITGGTPTIVLSNLGSPRQSTTDGFGNFYVADAVNNTIVEHTAAGATITFGTGLSAPQGLAADRLGNLYIADTGNNRILYYSPLTGNQQIISVYPYTLNAPTTLALDAAGDLYIVDSGNSRLLEIPIKLPAQSVALPTGTIPAAIASDLSGNLYIADKNTSSILVLAPGSSTATTLLTNITAPTDIAVSSTGNVFVADSSQTAVHAYNRALNTSVFTTTNIGLTSLPVTLTLSDLGNLPLTLSTPPYAETGNSAAFLSSGTPTCTAGATLTPNASCTQTFVFTPTTPGVQSAQAVFSTTTSQTATANFSATATNLILTTLTLTQTSPAGGVNYGQTATYTVTLTPNSSGSSAISGTINFFVDGQLQSSKPVSSNPYLFTATLSTATHSISVSYSGDAIYSPSNASISVTVNKAITTTTVSYSQSPAGVALGAIVTPTTSGAAGLTGNVVFYVDGAAVSTVAVGNGTVTSTVLVTDGPHAYYAVYSGNTNYATSTSTTQTLSVVRALTSIAFTSVPTSVNGSAGLLLTATVTGTGTGTPSGTVTFTNGTATLGKVTLVNGTASITTNTTTYASYSFTVAYSGDGLYQPSTVTITQGPDFAVVSPVAALVVAQGSQAVASVNVLSVNGYSGTLTPACSNLPVNMICRFLPAPFTLAAGGTTVLSVQVFAGISPATAQLNRPSPGKYSRPLLAFLLLVPAAFGLRRRILRSLVLALVAIAVFPLLTGCGNKTPAAPTATFVTPIGTTPITITMTDTNGIARAGILNVTVNSQ